MQVAKVLMWRYSPALKSPKVTLSSDAQKGPDGALIANVCHSH